MRRLILVLSFIAILIGQIEAVRAEYLLTKKDGTPLSETEYEQIRKTIFLYETPTSLFFQNKEKVGLTQEERLELGRNEEKFIKKKINEKFPGLGLKVQYIPNTLYQLSYLKYALEQVCTLNPKEVEAVKSSILGIISDFYEHPREKLNQLKISLFPKKYGEFELKTLEEHADWLKKDYLRLRKPWERKIGKIDSCQLRTAGNDIILNVMGDATQVTAGILGEHRLGRQEHIKEQLDLLYDWRSYELNQRMLADATFQKLIAKSDLKGLVDSLQKDIKKSWQDCEASLNGTGLKDVFRPMVWRLEQGDSQRFLSEAVTLEHNAHENNQFVLFRGTNGFKYKDKDTLDGIEKHSGFSGLSYAYELLSGGFYDSSMGDGAMALAYFNSSKYGYALTLNKASLYHPESVEYKILGEGAPSTPALQGLFASGESFHPRIKKSAVSEEEFQNYLKEHATLMKGELPSH